VVLLFADPAATLPLLQSPLAVIGGHSRAVSYVRFMGDGRRLLTASTDSALKLWDIAAEMARPTGQPAAPQLTYTGRFFLLHSAMAWLWPAQPRATVLGLPRGGKCLGTGQSVEVNYRGGVWRELDW
jgi:WD40 repeat protein